MRWILLIFMAINLGIVVTIGITYHYTIQFLEEMPQDLFQMLQEYSFSRSFLVLFDDYLTYIYSQWNGKNLIQIGSLMAIIMAALQFAGERSKKTMSFFLSRPFNRREGFLGKVLAGTLFLISLFGITTILLYFVSSIIGYGEGWGRFFTATILSLLWLTVFYLLCCLISLKASEPIPAAAIMGGGALLISSLGLFSRTRPFSPFYQMSAGSYFMQGASPLISLLPALIIIFILLRLGIHLFEEEDY